MKVTSTYFFLLLSVLFFIPEANAGLQESSLTEQECIAFANNIDKEMKNGHPELLTSSFDVGEFLKIVDKGISEPKYKMAGDKSFRTGFEGKFKFGEEVYATAKEGHYDFLKYYSDAKSSYHVVFRLFSSNSGLNYHDFELIKKDGKVKIVDCFILVTGERLSATVRNLLLQFMISSDTNSGNSVALINDFKTIKEVNQLIKNESYEDALNLYKTTTEDFRNTKLGRISLILILVHTDYDEYVKKIDEYEKKYPNDPNLNLVLMDGYFLRQNYDKALECVNVLEKNYGPDFILDYYKGNLFFQKVEYQEADKYYEKAALGNNNFKLAYESVLITSLELNNYTKVYEISKQLNERFSVSKKDLKTTFESYPDFKKSQEYKKLNKELN